jgi:hypothetical protein
MSLRWVESIAPLVDEPALLESLESLGARYQVADGRIVVEAQPEPIVLERRHAGWIVRRLNEGAHAAWERRLDHAYRVCREQRAARLAEVQRLEEERRQAEARRALVETRRAAITEKARQMGYSVREERRGEEIQLVLVKRTY